MKQKNDVDVDVWCGDHIVTYVQINCFRFTFLENEDISRMFNSIDIVCVENS